MATFKTRARALDMLGRQQIAGIPTAVAELFKNAHDAYADRVEVDYFRQEKLFLLRDDGIGMTRQDFEDRWLTLGTESKMNSVYGLTPPAKDLNKQPRPVLGEKGIGRLAVAVIGPQVLIFTRAKRSKVEQQLVAAFVHWGLFESPGIDLDQIEIPIRTFGSGDLPTQDDVVDMVGVVRKNVERLEHLIGAERAQRLHEDLASFDIDPHEYDGSMNGPSLKGEKHGTHFYIRPASKLLADDIDQGEGGDDTAPPLIKLLIGFTNTMTPDHPPPVIRTSFRDHRTAESYRDVIRDNNFFTPDEFRMADHHIAGNFDEYGKFTGTVNIYGEKRFEDHVVPWPRGGGRRTSCGPFRIELAYVQGRLSESRIPAEDYQRLIGKLERLGGMYLYRDGIRILPYGDTDYDWLEIEKRRTKSASYYYFSFRRMFGIIEISREENASLNEKAGREGFRENTAYRQFRDILKNFFIQIAADFFRSRGTYSDYFVERRAEVKRANIVRRERENRASAKRKAFAKQLDEVFERIAKGEAQRRAEDILDRAQRAVERALNEGNDARAAEMVIAAEVSARRQLSDLNDSFRLERPRSFGLTGELIRDWEAYQRETQRLNDEIFTPALKRLDEVIGNRARLARLDIDTRRRAEAAVRATAREAQTIISTEIQKTWQALQGTTKRVQEATRAIEAAIEQATNDAVERSLEDGSSEVSSEAKMAELSAVRELEQEISELARREQGQLADVREQLQSILRDGESDGMPVSLLETLAALEEELLAVRERSEADAELVQLGMAVDVINHEFNQTVASIRTNLRRLKSWADANDELRPVYRQLRTSFEHLDGYLTLFAPLQRRLYRKAIPITGRDIAKYLRDLFGQRLRRQGVRLETTPDFLEWRVLGFPSTFYPVFINLIDNALYWLRDTQGDRVIRLDADGDSVLVNDTGPGIPDRDRDVIFDPGFTRKPGGRGLGLYIVQSVLSRVGYRIELIPKEIGQGATFRIEPIGNIS